MAHIGARKAVLCVKNEGTNISDSLGVFQMIKLMDYVYLGCKDTEK